MELPGEGSKASALPTSCLLPQPSQTHNPFPKMTTYNWYTSQHDFPFSLDACKGCLHPSPRMCTSL